MVPDKDNQLRSHTTIQVNDWQSIMRKLSWLKKMFVDSQCSVMVVVVMVVVKVRLTSNVMLVTAANIK